MRFWLLVMFLPMQLVAIPGLFLDAGAHERDLYRTFFTLAGSCRMPLRYYALPTLLDQKPGGVFQSHDKIAFFLCNAELLQGNDSPAADHFFSYLRAWRSRPGSMTVVMIPWLGQRIKLERSQHLVASLGVVGQESFLTAANAFLGYPLELRGGSYYTMLNRPRKKASPPFPYPPSKPLMAITPLPYIRQVPSRAIRNLAPFGIYWYDARRQNHLVISCAELPAVAGVAENFRLWPTDPLLQRSFWCLMQQFLWELQLTTESAAQGFPQTIVVHKKPPVLPVMPTSNSRAMASALETTAWMETTIFDQRVRAIDQAQRERDLVTYILDAELDAVWLSVSPNMYYSPIAKRGTQTNSFLAEIRRFTKLIATASAERQQRPPRILVGFEIANNFVDGHLPQVCAVDCFGNQYADIPDPLDDRFWDLELLQPLMLFVRDWKKVSNGLSLGGVVIDLEMYGRQRTSSFHSTLEFSPRSCQKFKSDGGIDPSELVSWLIRNHRMTTYFDGLYHDACVLGKRVAQQLRQLIPGAVIGCYMPSPSLDWWYRGFLQGLGSPKNPVRLFTFAQIFDQAVFAQYGVNVVHSGAILLSKLSSKKDFVQLDRVGRGSADQQGCGRIWLNRFSRMVEDYKPNEWYTNEQTPMSKDGKRALCRYLASRR